MLLPRHQHPGRGLLVLDQLAGEVAGDAVDRAGEREGRLIRIGDRVIAIERYPGYGTVALRGLLGEQCRLTVASGRAEDRVT